jgi:hypothetical protein
MLEERVEEGLRHWAGFILRAFGISHAIPDPSRRLEQDLIFRDLEHNVTHFHRGPNSREHKMVLTEWQSHPINNHPHDYQELTPKKQFNAPDAMV